LENNITNKAYLETLDRLKEAPQDRVLTLSLMGALTIGGITLTEVFSDGAIEHISSVLENTMVDDSWFGDANPFEDDISDLESEAALFIGSVGLLYMLTKGIKSGKESEDKKNELIKEYESNVNLPKPKEHNEDDYLKFIDNLKTLISSGKITQDDSDKYLRQVELGAMSLSSVLKITDRLVRR